MRSGGAQVHWAGTPQRSDRTPILTSRPFSYAVAGLITLQALTMYLFAARGAFFADDLMYIGMARVDFHSRLGLRI